MTLRRKLAIRYSIIAGTSLILLAGLAHHEFIVEPRVRQQTDLPKPSASLWGEYAEVFFYSMIPIVLGCGWWFMRRTLTPINHLADRMDHIHAANLDSPLPLSGTGDEVDRLTIVFNEMTRRLDRSFQEIREFTLHASHELKTPLTIMQIQLETMLAERSSLPTAHVEWIECQINEIQRLSKMVDSLTLLAKADTGLVKLDLKLMPLDDLVQECFEDAQILAEPHGIHVTLARCEPSQILGDRDRIWQLLLNLMDNAIKYNHPGGSVELKLCPCNGQVTLDITNTGAGIPPEQQTRVFERFVRGDEARRRAIEGSGLGLSICQWIVNAHNGTIEMRSKPGQTTTVSVHLPPA